MTAGEKGCFDSGRDLFTQIGSREWYRTQGFRYAAFFSEGCINSSFRSTAMSLNAAREQPLATPVKTLHDGVRYESKKIQECINDQISTALRENGFAADGMAPDTFTVSAQEDACFTSCELAETIQDVARDNEFDARLLLNNPIDYERRGRTVEVHIDDVGVKRQKKGEHAKGSDKKRVTITALYIRYDNKAYRHCEPDLDSALRFVLGFLLHNNLLDLRLRFFTDGERQLKKRIFEFFSWHQDVSLILDWKHASKKPYDLLSMATYKKYKEPILNHVRRHLWHGQTQTVIDYLSNLPADQVRNEGKMKELIGYFERNLQHIPCYSVRKELGLTNSSNRVEKTNDMLIAYRQKKKGMAWCPLGSLALGTLTAVKKNRQTQTWLRHKTIELTLVPIKPKKLAA